ncbi:MAG: hypothetical protein M1825_005049 [Sarcosagium campestre]|nr:MAG: hypothetical protein M1825_005049 [Sarcosagium campestre]
MSENQKPGLFGAAASSGTSNTNLFGQTPSSSSGATSSLFGTSQTPTTSTSGLFGSLGKATGSGSSPSLFGAGAAKDNASNTSAVGQNSSVFAGPSNPSASAGFSFGPKPDAGSAPNTSSGSGFSTPNKLSLPGAQGSSSAPSIFAKPNTTSGSAFGNIGSADPGSSGALSAATPASSKPSGFGINSTTPAGLPASLNTSGANKTGTQWSFSNETQPKSGLFGAQPTSQAGGQATGGLFSSQNKDVSATPVTSGTSLFGATTKPANSSVFDTSKPSNDAATASSSPKLGGLFGASSNIGATSTSSTAPSQPAFSLNLSSGQSQNTAAPLSGSSVFGTKSIAGTPPASQGTGSSLFSALGTSSSTSQPPKSSLALPPTTSATNTTPSSSLFSQKSAPTEKETSSSQLPSFAMPSTGASAGQASDTATKTSGPGSSSLFGALSSASSSQKAPATTGTTAADKPAATATLGASGVSTSTSTATSSAPVPTFSLGGNKPSTSSVLGASAAKPSSEGILGASSTGAAPPPQSRLKNKSMEDIINVWAKDLVTYQTEFQNYAQKIATWDRLLVENGEKITKLYTSTFDAERASSEVERQLSAVEGQQDELSGWLDRYEREVDEMTSKQVGQGEALQGPDQERERTYKLAERLSDRMDEMGADLKSMIEEINSASVALSQTNKEEDPLSQIVKILNGHLSSLQWIDQNAATLQAKVLAAQKAAHTVGNNGYRALGDDAADDFYRSYTGRRY